MRDQLSMNFGRLCPALLVAAASLTLLGSNAAAQARQPASVPAAPGEITGRLSESGNGAAVGSGSVTVLRASDGKFAGGALPNADGRFHVDALPVGKYTVRVRAMGFGPVIKSDVSVTAQQPVVDLGIITLSRVATQLGAQVVSAEREDVQLAPDRNVYSTKNMATAQGGTAIDVLRNVPSVEVDASNQVSLRGSSNVVVQINGRASPLKGEQLGNFLQQLPASVVKHVEVATNPSAKDDPEGTAGILNIVLNQDTEMGLSGGVNAATGTNGQKNVSGNVGRQVGAFTWFLSYGLFSNHQQQGGYSEQTNLAIPVPAYVNSRISGSNRPLFQNGMLRTEYRFDKSHALSLDGSVGGGHFTRNSASYFSDLDTSGTVIGLFDDYNDGSSNNTFEDLDLAFRRTGNAGDRTYNAELRGSKNYGDNQNDLFGLVLSGDASTGAFGMPRERDLSKNGNPQYTGQFDFTQPFGANTKLETGFKEILRHTTSDFTAAYLDTASGVYVPSPTRATSFDYQEQIGSGYAVLSRRFGKVQTQGGLRLEEAGTQLRLPLSPADSQRFDNRYASVYPSAILGYDFTPTRQVKLSYSRRVSRPWPGQLSPVEYRQDSHTIFRGNPDLHPEYTDAMELRIQDSHNWGTLQLNPFLRRTNNAVRFIQTTDTTGVTLGTYANVASTTQEGVDANVQFHTGKLRLFTGGSVYHYRSNASNLPTNLSTSANVWSTHVNGTWSFSKTLDLQTFMNYRAPMATEGGRQRAMTMMNFALRQKLWSDKGSITVRVADPFNMMTFGGTTINSRVIQSTVRHFGMRGIVIAFSRQFGEQLRLRPQQPDDQQQQNAQPGVP